MRIYLIQQSDITNKYILGICFSNRLDLKINWFNIAEGSEEIDNINIFIDRREDLEYKTKR